MNAPCKDCPERAPHCHAACERYAAYKQAKAEASARYQAEMAAVGVVIDSKRHMAKARKETKRKGW